MINCQSVVHFGNVYNLIGVGNQRLSKVDQKQFDWIEIWLNEFTNYIYQFIYIIYILYVCVCMYVFSPLLTDRTKSCLFDLSISD